MGAAQPLFSKPIALITPIALRISSILLSVLHDFFFPTFSNDSYHLNPPVLRHDPRIRVTHIRLGVFRIGRWVIFRLRSD